MHNETRCVIERSAADGGGSSLRSASFVQREHPGEPQVCLAHLAPCCPEQSKPRSQLQAECHLATLIRPVQSCTSIARFPFGGCLTVPLACATALRFLGQTRIILRRGPLLACPHPARPRASAVLLATPSQQRV